MENANELGPPTPTALALIPSQSELKVMVDMANSFAAAQIQLPPGCGTPQSILLKMIIGRELGISPAVSMNSIHMIEGRASLPADLMVGLVRRRGLGDVRLVESTTKSATVEAWRSDRPNEKHQFSFTMEDAHAAELAGRKMWKKYPDAMLRARAQTKACRALFHELFLGIAYSPEELGHDELDENGNVMSFTDTAAASGIQKKKVEAVVVTPEEAKDIAERQAVQARIDADPLVQQVKEAFDGVQIDPPPVKVDPTPPAAEAAPFGPRQRCIDEIKLLSTNLKFTGVQLAEIKNKYVPSDRKANDQELQAFRKHLSQLWQLRWMRKDLGIPDDKWQQTLSRRAANSDHQLSAAAIEELVNKLGEMLTPFKRREATAELNAILGVQPAAAPSTAGNG